MKTLFRNNGLTLVLVAIFLLTWLGQFWAGLFVYNDELAQHGSRPISGLAYLFNGHFWQATGENWESEFLQMAMFVILTTFLFQKGSPESNDPDDDGPEERIGGTYTRKDAPWPLKKGGIVAHLYAHSLSITFFLLFLASLLMHAAGGLRLQNLEREQHKESAVSLAQYFWSSEFWFESFQNWQSEFLSLAAMVFLSVYLREKGSAESKRVSASHNDHE